MGLLEVDGELNITTMFPINVILSLLLFFQPNVGCLEADIIILADVSMSIDGYEVFLNTAIVSFIDGLQITENGIRVGIISFAGSADVVVPITGDPDVVDDKFKKFKPAGTTDMASGLMEVKNEFRLNGREGYQKIVVIISDGDTKNIDECIAMVDAMMAENIMVCGVLILNDDSKDGFMARISGTCYLRSAYQNLIVELNRLDFCL